MSNFEDILSSLGTGRWTYAIFFWASMNYLRWPAQILSGAFVAPAQELRCVANATQCQPSGLPCDQFQFVDESFNETLTSEFLLVCNRAPLRSLYSSLYMFGYMPGALLGGVIADRYGRKAALNAGLVMSCILPLLVSVSPSLPLIMTWRFLLGAFHPILLTSFYTILMEVAEHRHRAAIGILTGIPWAVGIIAWALLGYHVRAWRWLNAIASLCNFLFIPCIWLVPESPRWLVVQGRFEEAATILKKAAKLNNTKLMEDERLYQIMQDISKDSTKSKNEKKDKNFISSLISELAVLLSTGGLLRRTLSLWSIFVVLSMVYYGLAMGGVAFSDDPYVYMALGGVMELPAYTVNAWLVVWLGRRLPTVCCLLVCAGALAALPLVPQGAWLLCLAMVGKMTITMAYQSMYVYMMELFPTEARTWGVGTTTFISRIGSIMTPYLVDNLAVHVPWLPTVIFAGSCLAAGAVTCLLPETGKLPMPDTVADTNTPAVTDTKEALSLVKT